MLFNTEIDTPTVALTLFRLLDGQNLNYGVVFDLSGKKVTSLMVLGPAPKTGGTAGAAGGSARTQPTNTSRGPRREVPAVEDDPPETEPEPTPQPNPVQAPAAPPRLLPGGQAPAAPPSPFAPRSPFGTPFGPRPTPSPSA
jgi:2-oxoglutarate dehydrogenase E2 component (dihydrolipoamide succinyltransferase)